MRLYLTKWSLQSITFSFCLQVKIHPVEGETSSSCKIKYGDKVRITADGNKALYRPGIFNWNFRPVFGTFKAPKTYDSKTEWILKNPHKDDDRSTIRAGDCMHITSAAQVCFLSVNTVSTPLNPALLPIQQCSMSQDSLQSETQSMFILLRPKIGVLEGMKGLLQSHRIDLQAAGFRIGLTEHIELQCLQ